MILANFRLGYCRCGCGEEIPIISKHRPTLRKFQRYHDNKGIHNSGYGKKRPEFGNGQLRDKNPNWKGDQVGYAGLHRRLRIIIKKPDLCQLCKKKSPRDIANMTGIYNLDLRNWAYLCRSCHSIYDGKVNTLPRNERTISI